MKEQQSRMVVNASNTALALGSGDLPVFATPSMVALMENAAMQLGTTCCEQGETTVGVSINASHIKASPIGEEITATASLCEVDGRKLTFKIKAEDSKGATVGEAEHIRYIVNIAKFMGKL